MLLLSVLTIAQQPPKKSQSAREDLIQKSKNQKTTGFLLLGIGAAASVGGATIFTNNFTIFGKGDDNAVTGGAVLFLAGTLSVLGSIPFFIASANNKQKAMSIHAGLKMEKIPRNTIFKNVSSEYPAVALCVNLR